MATSTLVRFEDMTREGRDQVRRTYVNWTYDRTVSSFEEWAAGHAFYVRADGLLDQRYRHCEPACLVS